MGAFSFRTKYVRSDAWRGYRQPVFAVAGVNDTGMWSDSPCPSNIVGQELRQARGVLRKHGLKSRTTTSRSSNVFCGKRWLVVPEPNLLKAKKVLSRSGLYSKTRYLYEAD